MPHISIEYSANIDTDVDLSDFCECLRRTATDIDAFPVPGVRVRALRAEHYAIADGQAQHGFIDISVRLRGGRDLTVRKAATDRLFQAAKEYLAPVMERRSIALSLEMRNIDPELAPKTGTIRDYLNSN